MDISDIRAMVADAVRGQLELDGVVDIDVDDATILLGEGSVIDSLGLVNVIVAIEQRLADEQGTVVMLVDATAMAAPESPFRSVTALTAYVAEKSGEG